MGKIDELDKDLDDVLLKIINILDGIIPDEFAQKSAALMIMHQMLMMLKKTEYITALEIIDNNGDWRKSFQSLHDKLDIIEKLYREVIFQLADKSKEFSNPIFDQMIDNRFKNN